MLTPAQEKCLIEAKARLASGVTYSSVDAYYQDKDDVREFEAKREGKSPRQTDPMGYWYGGQSK